jgi:hypothetical protein
VVTVIITDIAMSELIVLRDYRAGVGKAKDHVESYQEPDQAERQDHLQIRFLRKLAPLSDRRVRSATYRFR